MKVIKVTFATEVIERILTTGYETRGGFRVANGIPPGARLEQANMNTDPFTKQDSLTLYFTTDGDGVEEMHPTLVKSAP